LGGVDAERLKTEMLKERGRFFQPQMNGMNADGKRLKEGLRIRNCESGESSE
jgi:hypothetical protein